MEGNMKFEYLKYLSESSDKKAILHDLMTAYGQDVWNYAYSMTRKWDQADDITQEVFLKVYRNLYSFRCESSVKTWLLAITRNMTLDYRKSAFLRRVTLVDYFLPGNTAQASAEDEVMAELALDDMWSLVLELPVKYREVLILFAHHQLSMKEMAEVLGVSEGTVKSRLYHARSKISKLKESRRIGSEG
ncbi:RNA polymerase sigma factor [Paenibacillus mucilaginosus]|uniref:RNA polymerase sigma factor n=3 Tax=Paenibacillus mucilaginosus TaxID=61624 RepID=H6NQJ2_9BACL|nr:sigma-70 family RNA polymerase sigma factor [Paenibacillus mucilaginosus]AEI45809.1 RNA polymerase sigma-70 factor [Paenibacillus mucilaginosus KNP414]AFC33460.1 RNA polymerase sigma-70 factor [Paenibacillus mucilaginosus 3016]AFH65780.1 RNA polymerase sigma70 factor [Paenibacillus mucilaginosus K02]MCG7215010.1 sigma-70 family RNA polymerase sigma factor [Paenibacillus mucilaginosus]WDM27180.1 sigma-70 family RNA polymerase sigma factor [Paenibacillus mucilaginosus]